MNKPVFLYVSTFYKVILRRFLFGKLKFEGPSVTFVSLKLSQVVCPLCICVHHMCNYMLLLCSHIDIIVIVSEHNTYFV